MFADAILVLRPLTSPVPGWSLALLLTLVAFLRGLRDLARVLCPQESGDRLELWRNLMDYRERRRNGPPARSRSGTPDAEDDTGPPGGDSGDSGAR